MDEEIERYKYKMYLRKYDLEEDDVSFELYQKMIDEKRISWTLLAIALVLGMSIVGIIKLVKFFI